VYPKEMELIFSLYKTGFKQVVIRARYGGDFGLSDLNLYHILFARKEGMHWSYFPNKTTHDGYRAETRSSLYFYFEKDDYAHFDEEIVILCGEKFPMLRDYNFLGLKKNENLIAIFEDDKGVKYGLHIKDQTDYQKVQKFMEAKNLTFWVDLYLADQDFIEKLKLNPIDLSVKTDGLL